jgi:hypothetical protein
MGGEPLSAAVWIGAAAVGAAGLLGLHRLGLWLDCHGWLYYRKSSRRKGGWLGLAAAFDPNARRILELQEAQHLEEDENGDPARLRVTIRTEGDA